MATRPTRRPSEPAGRSAKATLVTIGPGSPPHVAGMLLQTPVFVPYRGAAAAIQDLLAGQISLMIPQAVIALPQASAGKIGGLCRDGKDPHACNARHFDVDEAGLPASHFDMGRPLWLPKDTPKPVIANLNAAVVETHADPAVRVRLAELGQEIPPRERQTPEALAATRLVRSIVSVVCTMQSTCLLRIEESLLGCQKSLLRYTAIPE